ncbi:N-acetylmuramoyl-L-alanine amidase [Streptomyces sp. ND04-05B]|uniref:N-acetylmuramoyl-L-alanine amidase n=1 Tax=Streptomyces sp. ND04-05B TaxID=3028693 RepID=UPI0029AE7582|nr:N-acetylmuramoyl-L-alanine amidase [Streptomyces sp. ND04-05B]MDX3064843.1 N-acetylmuramoyl-L-alanine amidase [Streptomyces sp. ND04-05B]
MRVKRRTWATAAVATAAVAGVLVLEGGTVTSGALAGPDAKSAPARADVRRTALEVSADGDTASLRQRESGPFSMLGVTWTDPSAEVTGTVEARTRSASSGDWSAWLPLDTEVDGRTEAGRPGVRGSTEPRWVGPSDGVEVRVSAGDGTSAGLPAGLRLDTVDPGRASGAAPAAYALDTTDDPTAADPSAGSSEEPVPGLSTEPATGTTEPAPGETGPTDPVEEPPSTSTDPGTGGSPSAPAESPSPSTEPTTTLPPPLPSTVPQPPIVSRAGWNADESVNDEAPDYMDRVKAVFVHHTAQTNSYSCADSAAIVRGLHAYHVEANGWKDLGYNFVVDKCGTVFEGRRGGADRAVMGAHTYGFNRETAGIAVIGMYTDSSAASAATTAVARVAAWKLGQYDGDPAGTTTLTAGADGVDFTGRRFTAKQDYSFSRISGHRDGFNTQCPGGALYAQLPAIRGHAAGPVAGLAITSVTGAALSGTSHHTRADITVRWSATTPAAFVTKYELLVDGRSVASTTGGATSAAATLTAGSHKVQVRATHQSGRTSVSATATVVADRTAPVFTTKPSLSLRTGTVNTAAVPIALKWKASDAVLLRDVRLTAPVAGTYGPTVTTASHTAKSAVATAWRMTAYDRAGNASAASVTGTPVILQESSAKRSGTWTTKSSAGYLGGGSYASGTKNAALTWTFTGRSVAWVVSRAATSGQAYVYVDGAKVATVDLKSSTTLYRQAIWTKSWTSSAKHTVKIVVVGTKGRPTLTTDGLVYLR